MLRDRLARMHRCTKSAEIAVEPSRFGRVLRAAKNSSPDSLFSPWQEKCNSSTSSGRLSEKSSSICPWIRCAASLCTTCTVKSPTRGSPSTLPSASASAAGARRCRKPSCSYSSLATIRALRWPVTAHPPSVPADEQPDQPVLIGGGRLGQLQHLTADLQPHRAAGFPAPRQPRSDRGDDRT